MEIWNSHALLIMAIFVIGYALITIEHLTKLNKSAIALAMAVLCWAIQFGNPFCLHGSNIDCFNADFSTTCQIIFFLLGALVIIEVISIHNGFKVVADLITVATKKQLLWLISFITFFLSAILDNLTTTLVMVSLMQRMIEDRNTRLIIGGAIVIAANAGGAWTPIGDVTTTMLWIGEQLTSVGIIKSLFIPSLVSLVASVWIISFYLEGTIQKAAVHEMHRVSPMGREIFYLGVILLISIPVLKAITGLPPFMGVLLGVSILWLVTDIIHREKEREKLKFSAALSRVDLSTTFFFLGILLAVNALDSAGILQAFAHFLDSTVGNPAAIATIIGLASAVIDNVPLVAASMGMYSLERFPQDDSFWQLIAFCAGTGGSILIIGSAAGVVYMGLEKVDFFWYLKKISFSALVGYFAGILSYLIIF